MLPSKRRSPLAACGLAFLLIGFGCAPISVWEVRSRPAAQAAKNMVCLDAVPATDPQLTTARVYDHAAEQTGLVGHKEAARLELLALKSVYARITELARTGGSGPEVAEAPPGLQPGTRAVLARHRRPCDPSGRNLARGARGSRDTSRSRSRRHELAS